MKEIKLTQGKVAIVDDCDFDELSKFNWYAQKDKNTYYAVRHSPSVNGNHTKLRMHRVLVADDSFLQIDHINGDGLDNRRENLRIVTNRQNTQNKHINKTSIYSGVSWFKRTNRWVAHIRIGKEIKHLGYFKKELDAYAAYCDAVENLGETIITKVVE
jgi:hypothetical protein